MHVIVLRQAPDENTQFTFVMAWQRGGFDHADQAGLLKMDDMYHVQGRSVLAGKTQADF